jgi:hypothetical protein
MTGNRSLNDLADLAADLEEYRLLGSAQVESTEVLNVLVKVTQLVMATRKRDKRTIPFRCGS